MTKWTVEVRGALLHTYVVIVILCVPSKLSCSAVCSMNVDYVRMLVGWFAWLLACPWLMGFPDRVPH